MQTKTPEYGQWPVDPQDDQPIQKERIWVDGCFDFAHHGHAGALLQARQLGKELYVGIHSDEAILKNKGPTVMNLAERVAAVEACRWATRPIPHAPYVTFLPWISHYGCFYVVHGDDITSDANGEDTYRYVKAAKRYLEVKRTPGISTTDLVGRMLMYRKTHFIKSLKSKVEGKESAEGVNAVEEGKTMLQRIRDYATDETGLNPGSDVWIWTDYEEASMTSLDSNCSLEKLIAGKGPAPGQRIVYVDGSFDLFCSGHIEFLKQVFESEKGEAYIVAGIHNDELINKHQGADYPIMNIFERGLCVLQCKYVNAVIFGAPISISKDYLAAIPYGNIAAVYHGNTNFIPLSSDPYEYVKKSGIFRQIPDHDFQHVNAAEIVGRIMQNRVAFEERQKRKGEKAIIEEIVRHRELQEWKVASSET